jgi:hypothetical protein
MAITFTTSIVSSGDMSGNITGSTTYIGALLIGSLAISWTGSTPVGNIAVQISNDGSVWVTQSIVPTGGADGQTIFNLSDIGYLYIRVNYTRTSGSGTLSASITGKVA